jgi:hypothetical protein
MYVFSSRSPSDNLVWGEWCSLALARNKETSESVQLITTKEVTFHFPISPSLRKKRHTHPPFIGLLFFLSSAFQQGDHQSGSTRPSQGHNTGMNLSTTLLEGVCRMRPCVNRTNSFSSKAYGITLIRPTASRRVTREVSWPGHKRTYTSTTESTKEIGQGYRVHSIRSK